MPKDFKPFEKVEIDESITDCPGHTVSATIVSIMGSVASVAITNRCEGCSCGPANRIINIKWLKKWVS
jgi:hypothetical protein